MQMATQMNQMAASLPARRGSVLPGDTPDTLRDRYAGPPPARPPLGPLVVPRPAPAPAPAPLLQLAAALLAVVAALVLLEFDS